MGIESGFVCLMLSNNHRQRKSRNLSCTNQFNSSCSLRSLEKSKKQQKTLLFQFGKNKKNKNIKRKKPSVLDTKSIHSKFSTNNRQYQLKINILNRNIMNTIVGRITQNAKINILKNDTKVVNFSVAINDSYKTKQGERKEQTTYYNCSYWINAKIAEYLIKGTLVELSGRISSSAWIGKDGEIKSGLNFHTSNIKLHGGKQKSEFNNEPTVSPQNNSSNPFSDETDDDLPF